MNDNINDKQEAAARKEQGGFHHPIFVALSAPDVEPVWIEAERWVDARTFARRILGAEVIVVRMPTDDKSRPFPRWQVRTLGQAGSITNPWRFEARQTFGAREVLHHPWRDVRDLVR